MMAKKYPIGYLDDKNVYHPRMCDSMVKHLWALFDQSGADLKYEQFCEKIELWVNQEGEK